VSLESRSGVPFVLAVTVIPQRLGAAVRIKLGLLAVRVILRRLGTAVRIRATQNSILAPMTIGAESPE
jgi:hypothetical protein